MDLWQQNIFVVFWETSRFKDKRETSGRTVSN